MLLGGIGTVYLAVARRQHEPSYLVCGFILIIYPWFVSNALIVILLGALVTAYPIAKAKGIV
ncbi:MAG: hypothetical protein JWO97_3240 [Acidobacteria bacterium]|nr:hypothetical protein [Acidobacteriota bacterium]